MKRCTCDPRKNWKAKLEALDFNIYNNYWNEGVYYQFSAQEIDDIEAAANEVHEMCMSLIVDSNVHDIIDAYDLPMAWKNYILFSFNQNFTSHGRFDFIYNPQGELKLLEYNADTPTGLYEAAVVQWHWLQDLFKQHDQFNSLHESLIAHWQNYSNVDYVYKNTDPIYFTCMEGHAEDYMTVRYLMDCVSQANKQVVFIDIESLGWNGKHFVDEAEHPINHLFKLYPYEWLMVEDFGSHLLKNSMLLIEPPWKYLLSNKVLLAMLWKKFPGHPNLVPAYLDVDEAMQKMGKDYVIKPAIGREGSNVTIFREGNVLVQSDGPYSEGPRVYQKYIDRVSFDRYYPTLGVWMIGDKACGMGIREDTHLITGNMSRFTPHLFTEV